MVFAIDKRKLVFCVLDALNGAWGDWGDCRQCLGSVTLVRREGKVSAYSGARKEEGMTAETDWRF